MPNFASVLKDEIIRLARKELRRETEGLKKASAHYRSEIAAVKRRVADLEKQVAHLNKKTTDKTTAKALHEGDSRVRFSAKGFSTHRRRLGLSATEMGTLLGVSAQTVYNWEAEKSRPRPQQLAAIATVRSMGKRQANTLLQELAG